MTVSRSNAFLWPVERIDHDGEPDAKGPLIKIGLRAEGVPRAIWVDILDAEALADGIRRLLAGHAVDSPLDAEARCDECRQSISEGEACYQATPAGKPCLKCAECAPTTQEESDALLAVLEGGHIPPGFQSRSEVISWRAFVRLGYPPQAKRLTPLTRAAARPEPDLIIPDPPETATIVSEPEDSFDD